MSILVLVRHGQASFLAEEYDRLSDLGRAQAEKLAEHWLGAGLRFTSAFCGPRERQIRTAEIVAAGFRKQGVAFPSVHIVEDWDEYAGEAVAKRALPALSSERPELTQLLNSGTEAEESGTILKRFQKGLEIVMKQWVTGELTVAGIETWDDFRERIRRGLSIATSKDTGGRHVVVFTSGGSIAAALQIALVTTNEAALELSWMVKNCALTEFLYTRDRMTLSGFNLVPHLNEPELITYR